MQGRPGYVSEERGGAGKPKVLGTSYQSLRPPPLESMGHPRTRPEYASGRHSSNFIFLDDNYFSKA